MREPLIFKGFTAENMKEIEKKLGVTMEIIKMEIIAGEHKGTIINVLRRHYDKVMENSYLSGYKDEYCYLCPLSELRRVEE